MPRRGFALVELLVVVVIILILAGAYLGLRGRGKGGGPETIPGKAMQKAESVACQSTLNLDQQVPGERAAILLQPADGSGVVHDVGA